MTQQGLELVLFFTGDFSDEYEAEEQLHALVEVTEKWDYIREGYEVAFKILP